MTLVLSMVPDWWFMSYIANGKADFWPTLMAFLSVFLRPFRVMQQSDPVWVEALSIWVSVWTQIWLYTEPHSDSYNALLRIAPHTIWQLASALVLLLQLVSWAKWIAAFRALTLQCCALWWTFLAYLIAREGFMAVHTVLTGLVILCLVASQVVDTRAQRNGTARK